MILPKYKFYAGKAVNFSMKGNTAINPNTGQEMTAINSVASNRVAVFTEQIYVNYSVSNDIFDSANNIKAEVLSVYMYKSDNTYIGRLSVPKAKMCTLAKNTRFIVIEFIGMFSDIMKAHNSLIKSGFSEIYAVRPVNPHYKELSKKYSKESGQEFFRISLEGKINLFGQDYELIRNFSLNDTLGFFIEKLNTVSGEWYEYYKGQFNRTDCKFGDEKKKCELKLSALDRYNKVMDNYDNAYDLIKLNPEISKINVHKRSLMQVYIRGANSISNFFGGTYWEDEVIEPQDNNEDLINKFHFAYIMAGNEFQVKGANINEANGIYAGINGTWINSKSGYRCTFHVNQTNEFDHIYIRDENGNIVYRSIAIFTAIDVNNIYLEIPTGFKNINDNTDEAQMDNFFVYHVYMRLLCDVDTIEDSEGTINTYDLPIDDFVADNRNYKKCIGLKAGNFFCTSKTVTEPTRYGINDYGEYFTNRFIPSYLGLSRPLPICRSTWANASLWYTYDDLIYSIWEQRSRKKYVLKNSYSIAAVIKALLSKIDPTVRHEATAEYSRFLYDTNTSLQANRFYVYITQKTNILKGQYDQAAQKAEITLEDVMKMLRDCFRCYWYIEDNKLKIEHISFFMNGGSYNYSAQTQLDFTKLKDQFNKKLTAYFQSEIEFDKSELNQRYEFNWMDDATELFGQVTIDVNAKYVQQDKKEEINVSQFSSDVDFMLFNPSNFSDDGFALLCPIQTPDSGLELPIIKATLIDENGDNYELIAQNWYASWAYLVNQFYMNDMPAQDITINVTGRVNARGIKKCMKHAIEFPIAEDLDELKLIATSFGNGKIDEYSVDINTRLAKVKLLYQPT